MNITFLYSETLIFCAIFIVLLLIIEIRDFAASKRAKRFFLGMWAITLIELFMDFVWVFVDGRTDTIILNKILETVYLALFPFVTTMWLGYIGEMFDIAAFKHRLTGIISITVNSIVACIVIASWKYGWVYYVDETGAYVRGDLAFLPTWTMQIGFAIAAMVLFIAAYNCKDAYRKQLMYAHAAYPVPIIILGAVQMLLIPGITTIYLGSILALAFLFYFARGKAEPALASMNEDAIYHQNEDESNQFTEIIIMISFFSLLIDYMINANSVANDKRIIYAGIYLAFADLIINFTVYFNHNSSDKYFFLRKYLIMSSVIFVVGGFQVIFSGTFYVAIPFILFLACRYYDNRFLDIVAVMTLIIMLVLGVIGFVFLGTFDANMIELYPGTNITIPLNSTWVGDGIRELMISNRGAIKGYAPNYIFACGVEYVLVYLLAKGINASGRKMLVRAATQAKEKAIREEDLSIAKHIQTSMLPLNFNDFSAKDELNVYALMHAAQEVGGDFYDFYAIDEDNVCLIVGDVSGKGVPAALFMVKAQTTIRGLSEFKLTPAQILTRANNILNERNEELFFVTIWMGILNLKSGKLSYGIAGHNAPLIYRHNGKYEYMKRELDIDDADNVAVGVMPDMRYSDFECQINPGDKILLYTDGVTDAMNIQKKQFGEDRLRDYLNVDVVLGADQTVKGLRDAIREFAGEEPQFDDITILSAEFKGYK